MNCSTKLVNNLILQIMLLKEEVGSSLKMKHPNRNILILIQFFDDPLRIDISLCENFIGIRLCKTKKSLK